MKFFSVLIFTLFLTGCLSSQGNIGQVQSYAVPLVEAEWIHQGEPIIYEDEKWYPQDGTESLLDGEVYFLGTYKDVQFFSDKEDVLPLKRLYTKFGRNKFRYYEKKENP